MKTLLLFRHAEAAAQDQAPSDHARPLTERGKTDAQRMGRFLTAIDQHPDRTIASTAKRARQTLRHAQKAGGWPDRTEATDALYAAQPDDVLRVVHAVPDAARRLLLVGHNPTFTDVAERMMGGGRLRMATGTIACLTANVDAWAQLRFGRGQLRWLLGPKQISR